MAIHTKTLALRQRGAKYTTMKTTTPTPETIIIISKIIGRCDYRTTVSRYTTCDNSPWVITVGESTWRRHLIVEKVTDGGTGLDAELAILCTSESNKFGYDIRTDAVSSRIRLIDLVADRYISVKKALFPSNHVIR